MEVEDWNGRSLGKVAVALGGVLFLLSLGWKSGERKKRRRGGGGYGEKKKKMSKAKEKASRSNKALLLLRSARKIASALSFISPARSLSPAFVSLDCSRMRSYLLARALEGALGREELLLS